MDLMLGGDAEAWKELPLTQACELAVCKEEPEASDCTFLAPATASKAERAYLERLNKAAAEAAAKGYPIKRKTHHIRRTRVHKTTSTTDNRTMSTERKTEAITKVEEWVEDGAPQLTGVGVIMARGKRSLEQYADGTKDIIASCVKGQANFWLGGDALTMCNKQTYEFATSHGRGEGRFGGASASWAPSIAVTC